MNLFDGFLRHIDPFAHTGIVKVITGSDRKISRIIGFRIVDFEIGDTECHHYICRRMSLREHILDLLAGFNIPVRYICRLHIDDILIRQTFPFSNLFHNFERFLFLYPFVDEIDHDTVTSRNGLFQSDGAIFNQSLSIPQPYVRTVGQTGNTQQVRKGLWFCIDQHPSYEFRTKFRNTQCPCFTIDILFCYT